MSRRTVTLSNDAEMKFNSDKTWTIYVTEPGRSGEMKLTNHEMARIYTYYRMLTVPPKKYVTDDGEVIYGTEEE